MQKTIGRGTYSPEDNKLRLYPDQRLPRELYERVRRAGFIWAPKQDLFVAPRWTPDREDLLIELCGDVEDEDQSLVERAAARAERFEGYSEARGEEAGAAHLAVSAIADNIPLGQPILVGHHSERRARRDAEKIENGMRRAVRLWDTSQYWQQRAAGALRSAKYKERADVRARRIKKLEAERRGKERAKEEAARLLAKWEMIEDLQVARLFAGNSQGGYLGCVRDGVHNWSADDVLRPDGERYNGCPSMSLEEVKACARRQYPATIARAERWIAHYTHRIDYERAMMAESGGIATDRQGPEVGGAVRCWCSHQGWSYVEKVNRVSVAVLDNWGNGGGNFRRLVTFDDVKAVMSAAQVLAAREAGRLVDMADKTGFHLLDEAPAPAKPKAEPDPQKAEFETLRAALDQGVKVVSAPNLFPTPADIADKMISLAEIEPGHRILEPSAGTGAILERLTEAQRACTVAVEINRALAEDLGRRFDSVHIHPGDFVAEAVNLGQFDRVLMNPPFDHGADVRHIITAAALLRPGGRLVAICACGPKQEAELKPLAIHWEELPAGTFNGTNIRSAILVI